MDSEMNKVKGTTSELQKQMDDLRSLVVRKIGGGPGAPVSTPL
jgi:hypothetical protein